MLRLGDRTTAVEVTVTEKRTVAPKPFSDASLIAAMCGVARFVKSAAVKKILNETDGLGTPRHARRDHRDALERGQPSSARGAPSSRPRRPALSSRACPT